MNAVICDYCGQPAKLITGAQLYRGRPDLAGLNFWHCAPCRAYVGTHRAGTHEMVGKTRIEHTGIEPLGRLADAELRRAKSAAHEVFDPIWKGKGMSRRKAYAWLAARLGIPVDQCHIGHFDVARCHEVIGIVSNQQL